MKYHEVLKDLLKYQIRILKLKKFPMTKVIEAKVEKYLKDTQI